MTTRRKRERRHLRLEALEDRRLLATFTVTNLDDGPVTGPGDLPGSLRQAVYDANAAVGADTIGFQAGLSGAISLTDGELAITDDLTINGPGAAELSVDAAGLSRVMHIDDGAAGNIRDVELIGLTITGGNVNGLGGGVLSMEALTIRNSEVSFNTATLGGGVYNEDGGLWIIASTVSHNSTSDLGGGGVFTRNAPLTIEDSTVADNAANQSGGGILARGDLTITRSDVTGNHAPGEGGGINVRASQFLLTDSVISDNYTSGRPNASSSGGGIFTYANTTVTNSTISGNHTLSAGSRGGGMFISNATATIADSTIAGNYTTENNGKGGGIYSRYGNTRVFNSTISGNYTLGRPASRGAGISVWRDSLTIVESEISGNSAMYSDGGGVFSDRSHLTVTDSTIFNNYAWNRGGGIMAQTNLDGAQTAIIVNSTVSGNYGYQGGGVFNGDGCLMTIRQTTITGNTVPTSRGGGVVSFGDPSVSTRVTSSIIADNTDSDVDYSGSINTFFSYGFNLIGTGNALPAFNNNDQTNVLDPMLGPLADNGGPTFTHALLAGSPAIDAGDPAAVAGIGDIPEFDQRGTPYGRVEDGDGDTTARIDVGAFEGQPSTTPICDFDGDGNCDIDDIDALIMEIVAGTDNPLFDLTADGLVDLQDRDQWLADAGALNLTSGNPYLLGDSTLDGVVDGQDFIRWNENRFTSTGKWSQADWNADGITDGQDFIIWNGNRFQSSDGRDRPVLVPSQSLPIPQPAIRRLDAVFASLRERDERPDDDSQAYVLEALV